MLRRSCLLLWMLLVTLACICAGPSPAFGQENATLRVVVTSGENGSPLRGANVLLRSPDNGETVQAGATNRDGYLELRRLEPGRYLLEVSYIGFTPHRDTLRLRTGRRVYGVELDVKQRQLEEVTVRAPRGAAQRQAGLQTIGAAELERIPTPGPGTDLASYLQTLPGVTSLGDRGGQVFIQGGAPTQNRFLVDGLPVIQPFHISGFYSAFPQNIVQNADLYTGGFGAEYGEALSSVLDVRLRPGNMKHFAGSGAVGPHLTSLSVEGPLVQNAQSFLFSARYSLMEEVAGPLFGDDSPIGFYDVTGRYSYQKKNTSCNVTTLLTHDEGSLGPTETREISWSNTVVGGRCLIRNEQFDHAFSIRGGYTSFSNQVGTVGAPEEEADHWEAYLILNGDQTILGQPVDFGGRVTVANYDAKIDEQFVGIERISEGQEMARAHWSLQWGVNDRLTITPGAVARVTTSPFLPTADPRLRLSFLPDGTDQQEISLAGGLYQQSDTGISDLRDAGTVFTVWRTPGEDDTLPRSWQAILSYRQQFGPGLEASVEGFYKNLQDIVVPRWQAQVGVNTETTRANGTARGVDARLEFQRGSFYGYVGYGWSKVTYDAATDDLGAWIEGNLFSYSPPHDRRHRANVVTSYEFWGTTASLSWEFGSGRPFTRIRGFDLSLDLPGQQPTTEPGTARTIFERPFGARLPATHRLDISLERSFDLSSRIALDTKLGAINAYDRPNIFFFDIDTLQRVDQSPFLPYFSLKLRAE